MSVDVHQRSTPQMKSFIDARLYAQWKATFHLVRKPSIFGGGKSCPHGHTRVRAAESCDDLLKANWSTKVAMAIVPAQVCRGRATP